MKQLLVLPIALLISVISHAQTTRYWVSGGDGNWNSMNNWAASSGGTSGQTVPNGATFIAIFDANSGTPNVSVNLASFSLQQLWITGNCSVTLTASGGNRTITVGDNTDNSITGASVTNADLVVESGSTLNITGTGTYTMAVTQNNNAGSQAIVIGTVQVNTNGALTKAANPTFTFNAGSTYIHNRDGGAIVTATWNSTSNCNIIGITGTALTGWAQTFGNLTWNNTGQTGTINANPGGNVTVAGTFRIQSTNGNTLCLNSSDNATRNFNITNFTQDNGTLDLCSNTNNAALTLFNVSGTFTQNAGTVTRSATGGTNQLNHRLVFNGTGNQSPVFSGTINSNISLELNKTAGTDVVTLPGSLTVTRLIMTQGTLDFGSTAITLLVNDNFTFTNGTILMNGNDNHIWELRGATNTYTAGTFTSGAATQVVNYSGDAAQTIMGLTYRNLIVSNYNTASVTARTKTLAGNTSVAGTLSVEGQATSVTTMALSTFNIGVTGTTTINNYSTLSDASDTGTNTFQGLVTINSGGSLTTANASPFVFQGGITNNGTFTKTGTGAISFNGAQTINNNSGSTMTMAGAITKDATGKLTITNSISSPIVFSTSFTTNSDVDLTGVANITSTGAFTINGAVTVSNQNTAVVDITGALNGNNASSTWVNAANATLNYKNATQPFNTNGTLTATAVPNTVIYGLNGAQAIRTASTTYHHLIIEGGNTKTASGLLNVNGNLTFQNLAAAGVLTTSTNNVVIAGNVIAANAGFSATITQTTGTLTALNLTVNGGNTLNLNSNATFSEDITVTNNSTLSLNASGGNTFNIAARDITVNNGSTLNTGTTNYTNILTLNRNATLNGAFDLWYDADSRTSLVVNSNVAHAFSGTPTAFQLYNLTLNASSNTTTAGFVFDMEGSVNIGAGSTFDAGALNHTIFIDWTNSGTLTNAGTFTFDGAAQNIGAEPHFYNLILQGSGTKTISGSLAIGNNLTINAGITINTTTNSITVTESAIAANTAAATLTQTSGTFSAKNLLINGGNTFNLNSNATFSEDITVTNNSTLSLNSAGAAGFNISARDIIVNSGSTLTNGAANYTNTLTLNRNATINGTFVLWLDANSRSSLIINGNVAHAFTGSPTAFQLYNLTLNASSNTTTAGFVFDMEGSVNIGAGSTFDAGLFSHTVLVDWINSGTLTNAGTFTFDGGTQNIGAEPNFNHITFSTAGIKTFTGNITLAGNLTISNATVNIANGLINLSHTVNGNVTINSGSLNTNAANAIHSFTVGGDLTVNGTLDFWSTAAQYTNLTITGNIPHAITGTPGTFEVNNLSLAASSNTTTLGFDILTASTDYIWNDISIGNGATLDLNGKDVDVYGNITIASGGSLDVDANAVLTFQVASKSIQNSGNLSIQGTSGNIATITASAATNRFYIDNLSGSTLLMKYYSIDYLTGNGINVASGATADGIADNFSYGTFGANCNSSQCLQLSGVNFATNNPITVTSPVFNTTSGYNVNRTSGTGSLNLVNATGVRAGESFDNDNANPGTLVNWTYPAFTYYTVASGNFTNPAIWNADPTGHFNDATSVFQIMDGHTVTLNGDIDVLELIVGNGASGSLVIGNDATVRNLTTRESLTVQTGGTVNIGSDANHVINIYGNFINNGTTNLRNTFTAKADVNFYGPSSKVNGANPITFCSVTFKTGTTTTAHTSMDINWNLAIENGATFNDGGLTHTIAGDWTETGTGARVGNGTINFDETASTIKSTTAATSVDFYNVICTGTGSVVFATDLNAFTTNIAGSLTVNDDKIVLLTDDAMNISGDLTIGAAARFTVNAALLTFNGTSAQSINLSGDVTFYDLAFSGASTKSVIGNIKNTHDLTINTNAVVSGSGSHEIGRNLTIDGTCGFSGSITMKGGSLTSNNTSLTFTSLADLNITGNVAITTASTLAVTLPGNVNISANHLIINSNTSLACSGAGTFNLSAGFNLYIRDDNGFPTGFAAYNLAPTSIVQYDRDFDQVIRGGSSVVYGHLYIHNYGATSTSRSRTADGNIKILGNLYFENDPMILNLGVYNLNLAGNVTNTVIGSTINSAGGTFSLDADDAAQSMGIATYNLTNLEFALASPSQLRAKTIVSGASVSLTGNFITTCGSSSGIILDVVINDNSITGTPQTMNLGQYTRLTTTAADFGTNVLNRFVTRNLVNGTIHFASTTLTQTIPTGVTYGSIAFTGTQIKQAAGNLDINGNISVITNTPDFRGAGYTINVAGNWLLGVNNTTTFISTDKVILDGIDQVIASSNFQNLEIANTGTDSISGGNITIYGNLLVKNGANFAAKNRSITIHGNWTVENTGVFTQDRTSTVTFAGTTADQTVQSNANSYFGNLTITKNNGSGNQTLTANSNLAIQNSLTLTTDRAIFDLNSRQLNVGGNFTVNANQYVASNAFIAGTSTVIFDGISAQYIRHYSAYPLTFNNITFSTATNKEFELLYNPAVIDPTRMIVVNGNWTNNGQNVYAYVINNAGNTYVNFQVTGNWTNNGSFYHVTAGTVTFNGVNQNIGTSDFWNVVFAGTGTKTLVGGDMTVKQNLTINDGVTLDVGATENNGILANLNWTMSAAGAVFQARNGTVQMDGTGTIFTGHTGENTNKNFYNLTCSGTVTISGDLDVDNDFTVLNGSFATGNNTVYIGGNFSNSGTFTHANNAAARVIFNATGGTKTIDPGTGVAFRTLTINAATGTIYNLLNNFSINNNYDFTIEEGIFNLNGYTITVNTDNTKIVINPGGEFNINEGANVIFAANNQSIRNNGGVYKMVGTAGNYATLTRTGTSSYYITQSLGTFHARFYRCEAIGAGANGALTLSGGTLDATNNLSNGIFISGASTANTTAYIDLNGFPIDNTTNLTIDDVTFNGGASTNKNVRRNATPVAPNNGYVTFNNSIGSLTGAAFEMDDASATTGYVRWITPSGFYWQGDISADWHTPGNWEGNAVPSNVTDNVFFDYNRYIAGGGTNKVARITTANAVCGRIIINDNGSTGLGFSVEGGYDLNVNGEVIVSVGGVINVTSATSEISVGGDWTNAGTFTHGNGVVRFLGKNETSTITQASSNFYDLYLNSNDKRNFSLGSNLNIDNDFTFEEGTFDVVTRDINIKGDWLLVPDSIPVFLPKSRSVTFNGTATQTISNGTFNNLITAGTGTKSVLTNLDVNGTITIGIGTTLNGVENEIYVAGSWINNGTFTQTGNGTVIFDGGNQQIDNTGSTTTQFNKVTIAGTGTKTLYKAISVFGDLLVSSGANLDVTSYQIDGGLAVNSLSNNGSIYLSGYDNFPANFETTTMSSSSNVIYRYAGGDQLVKNSTSWSYGNLYLRNNSGTIYSKIVETGDLKVTGSLIIDQTDVVMNMASNNANLVLTGNLSLITGGQQINWGTGTSKFTHIGGDFNFDADITTFNNVELYGIAPYSWKVLNNNLIITGDFTAKNDVYVLMDPWNQNLPKTITQTQPGKTFTLESNARVYVSTPSAVDVAMPKGFSTYTLNSNSLVVLRALNGVNQTLYTANNITYGAVIFQNTKTVAADGISSVKIAGNWDMGACTFTDGGQNVIAGGGTITVYDYTPTAGVTFTLNGGNQLLYNNAAYPLRFANIVFGGAGSKTFGSNNSILISGNLTVNSGIAVSSTRPITFSGTTWSNNGKFKHTSTLSVSGTGAQTFNPGASDIDTYFTNIDFTGSNTINYITNGADINGTFTISGTATVNMGSLSHTIAGTVTNTAGGTWTTTNANITFDGGNQNINSPSFTANNVTINGTGTKRMFSNWDVNNLSIIASILNNYNNTSAYYALTVRGNYLNTGTFTHNDQSSVTFSASSDVTINNGAGTFWVVNFGDDAGSTYAYTLTAPTTIVRRTINLNEDANVKLNGNVLTFGYNTAAAKVFTVKGILDVNTNARLEFQNQGSVCTMTVDNAANPAKAILRLVGTDNTNIATLTRNTTGGHIININRATIEAKYYLIEYLANTGLNIQSNATLHATNNFSYGTFSNINNVAGACYLNLEAGTYAGGNIVDVVFNLAGTPINGVYNVKRQVSSPDITFSGLISGNLGNYKYEKDELSAGPPAVLADATRGKLRWPGVLETYWTGTINSDWSNPLNWTDGVPTRAIDAIIQDVTNDPIMNVDGECKKLRITNGILRLAGGFNISSFGDITIGEGTSIGQLQVLHTESEVVCGGSWTLGTNGIFAHGNATVVFNSGAGMVTITPLNSIFNHVVFNNTASTFNLAGTSLNVLGNFDITNGTVNMSTANYVLNLGGNFTNQDTLLPGTGTVKFNKAGNQTITNGNFNKVEIIGSGIKYTTGPCAISGTTLVTSTLQANTGSNIDFNGNVTINAGGTFNDGDESHTFTGVNWTGTGNYLGTGTVTFDLTTANQSLYTSKFYNLVIACTGRTLTLNGDVSIGNNLIVTNGVYALGFWDKQITNTSGLGTFRVDNSTIINISGANNFPLNFLYVDLASTTTTNYSGGINQIIRGGANVKYGNIAFSNLNNKVLDGNIEVLGNLYFNTSTLDVSSNNFSITISGTWNNNNSIGGTFIPRQGEVIFNGAANQSINVSDNSTNPFYHLLIDKINTILYVPNNKDLVISGNLNVTNGIYNANNRNTTIGGDMYAENGSFANSGTYILNKTSGTARLKTNFNYNNNTNFINNLTFNGGATYTLESDLAVYGNFYLNSGTLNADGYKVALGNASTDAININGNFIAGAGGQLLSGNGSSIVVGTTGSIDLVGTGSNPVIVSNNIFYNGYYAFTCNGTIKAEYYQFNFMNVSGIRVTSTGTIDATHNFSNGTFTNAANNTTFLQIENAQTFIAPNYIANVNFPTNPGGTQQKNVVKTLDSGTLEFWEASGIFAGSANEKDDYNRINWTGDVVLTWTGAAGTDWNNVANWSANFGPAKVPTGAENVIIANTTNKPKLTTFGQLTKNLTINTGSKLTIETPLDGAVADLTILGDFIILGSGNIEIKTANDFVEVKGSWTIPTTASYTNNGTITFNGSGSAKTIDNGGKNFNKLIIDGTTLYSLGRATTVTSDLTIKAGASLDVSGSSFALNVGGDWNNLGTFNPQGGTVLLNAASGPRVIDNNSSYFNNLNINATGVTYSLANHNLNINANFNLTAGTFNHNQLVVNMGNSTGVDNLNISGTAIYNVGANGTLKMGSGAVVSVTSGGTFNAVGTDNSNPARITRQSAGTYSFTVGNLARFGAQYYQFEYMNTSGIYLQSGAILHATNNLSNGVFSNGATGGTFLKLENVLPHDPTDEVIVNVIFNTGPTFNVTRTTGSTIAQFRDASGLMGYFTYENDAVMPADATTGLITWSQLNSLTWNGLGLNNSWHNPANWLGGIVPTNTNIVTIATSSNNPVIYESAALAKQLVIESGATLTVNNQNLTVQEEIRYAGTLTAMGTPRISTGGSWINASGTFNAGNSTVVLAAASGSYSITQGASTFYSLELNSGASYSLTSTLTASKDVSILSGTLNTNNFDMYVGGSWTKSGGTFIPGIRTVYFNGTGTRNINCGGTSFYNASFTGSATTLLSGNLNITNLLTQSAGTIDLSPDGGTTSYNLTLGSRLNITGGTLIGRSGTLNIGENWSISGSGVFTAGSSSVRMNNTSGTRTISTRSQAFNNLTINGAATFNLDGNLTVRGDFQILAGTLSTTTLSWPVNIGGNWVNNGTFTSYTSIVTYNGTSQQTVSGTGSNSFGGLTINNTSATGVFLSSPVIVKNALTLTDGYLYTTNVNLLTLNDNATSTSGSNASFVDGPVVKIGNDAFTFPLGDSAVWAPLAITAPSVITDAFRAEYFGDQNSNVNYPCTNCSLGIHHVSRAEFWDLARTVGTSNPDVTMYFKDMARSRITDLTDLIFAHYNGTSWERMGTNTGVSDGANMCHVTGTGFTSYSPDAPASANGNNVLPVTLVEFNAVAAESTINLSWTTASEIDNDFFTIQRSIDLVNYESIGYIQGAGNSSTLIDYDFVDYNPIEGISYYRLVQTDFNGKSESFNWKEVLYSNNLDPENSILMTVYPNPGNSTNIAVLLSTKMAGKIMVEIYNTTGDLLLRKTIMSDGTKNKFTLNLANYYTFPQGVYMIKATGANSCHQSKFVVE